MFVDVSSPQKDDKTKPSETDKTDSTVTPTELLTPKPEPLDDDYFDDGVQRSQAEWDKSNNINI